jgi:catechol 2,3-dioxygenase-like lactoylglutathione lyase family enzyme
MLNEPRFTHIALPVEDITTSVEWYERYTPLRLIDERRHVDGDAAWLCHPEPTDHPFIIVLVSLAKDRGEPHGQLGPFGHLGIELPTREAVDAMAMLGRADGCLAWEPAQNPAPVGYVCALSDPDGNVIEFSFDQGVYKKVREVLGTPAAN